MWSRGHGKTARDRRTRLARAAVRVPEYAAPIPITPRPRPPVSGRDRACDHVLMGFAALPCPRAARVRRAHASLIGLSVGDALGELFFGEPDDARERIA